MAADDTQFVTYREDGPVSIGTLRDSDMLDGSVIDEFGREVVQFVTGRKELNLLLDFHSVTYLASSALTELIKINDAVVGGGGSVRICGLAPPIQKVFEITNFDKSFDIVANEGVDHAIARFKRSLELSKEEDAWENRSGI